MELDLVHSTNAVSIASANAIAKQLAICAIIGSITVSVEESLDDTHTQSVEYTIEDAEQVTDTTSLSWAVLVANCITHLSVAEQIAFSVTIATADDVSEHTINFRTYI